MPTQHLHRLTIIVPAARCAALNAWIKANVDTTGGDWFTPSLSATGNEPATHAACGVALTEAEGKKLLGRLAAASGISQPANWDTMTRQQKKQWLMDQKAAIRSAIGVLVVGMENGGEWIPSKDSRTEMALKPIEIS